jgi:mono/diheme cytochrome c family protein
MSRLPLLFVLLLGVPGSIQAQEQPGGQPDRSGAALYTAACANCHGTGGQGAPAANRLLPTPTPDFTDCNFASREPDADWAAIIHTGGPVRAFDRMMPAFGDALSEGEIQAILDHVRTLCGDDSWPRGELNLPRALLTEKAYPEDEAVWTTTVVVDGPGAVVNDIVYEKRFGPRNQVELKVPLEANELAPGEWRFGAGDVALGFKRALVHSLRRGSIFSAAAEIIVPTGDESAGAGAGVAVFEPFVSFGQILPAASFLQAQAGVELPFNPDRAEREAFWRVVAGTTWAQGPLGFGRAWTPMVELVAAREMDAGAPIHWDIVPQVQITLNTRQHVMLNAGVRLPVNERAGRSTAVMVYVLWDWFDGGLFDGW